MFCGFEKGVCLAGLAAGASQQRVTDLVRRGVDVAQDAGDGRKKLRVCDWLLVSGAAIRVCKSNHTQCFLHSLLGDGVITSTSRSIPHLTHRIHLKVFGDVFGMIPYEMGFDVAYFAPRSNR